MTDEEAIQKMVEQFGGATAPPVSEYREIADIEVIQDAPINSRRESVFIPRIPVPTFVGEPDDSLGFIEIRRRDWYEKIWVAEHETYDPARNVLIFYGHWRVHLVSVWVVDGVNG